MKEELFYERRAPEEMTIYAVKPLPNEDSSAIGIIGASAMQIEISVALKRNMNY